MFKISFRKTVLLAGVVLSTVALSSCQILPSFHPAATPKAEEQGVVVGQQDNKAKMAGPMGLKNTSYLTEDVHNSIMQLKDMQTALQSLKNEVQKIQPAVQRINTISSDLGYMNSKFQNLLMAVGEGQGPISFAEGAMPSQAAAHHANKMAPIAEGLPMKILNSNSQNQTIYSGAQAKHMAAPKTFAQPLPQGAAGLLNIRVGEHAGKTRVVLDMASALDVKYDVDKAEKIAILEIPGAAASALSDKAFSSSKIVKSYTVQKNGDNTLVIFSLKRVPSEIKTTRIKGGKGSADRLVFDMIR